MMLITIETAIKRRRVVVATVTAALLLAGGYPQAPANADEDTVAATSISTQEWTSPELEALALSTRSTLEQARERVELDAIYEQAIGLAEERYPSTFGGYEIAPSGPTSLTLFFTDDEESALDDVLTALPRAVRIDVRRVEHTQAYLHDLYERAQRKLPALAGEGRRIKSLSLNLAENSVVVSVETAPGISPLNDEARREAASGGQPDWPGLTFVEDPRTFTPTQCYTRDDCQSMRGGTTVVSTPDGALFNTCTMGFTGYDRTTNLPYVVTAAHCGRGNQFYSQGQNRYYIGQSDLSAESIFEPDGDPNHTKGYDAIRVPDQGKEVGIRPFIFEQVGYPDYPIYRVGSQTLHRAGVSRCFAGSGTHGPLAGPTCGPSGYGPNNEFFADGAGNWWVPNAYRFHDVCIELGDSGAPVYRSNTLDGMLFGRTLDSFGQCTGTAYSAYMLAEHVADALNLRVLVACLPGTRPPYVC